jgi:hypothetical protein
MEVEVDMTFSMGDESVATEHYSLNVEPKQAHEYTGVDGRLLLKWKHCFEHEVGWCELG